MSDLDREKVWVLNEIKSRLGKDDDILTKERDIERLESELNMERGEIDFKLKEKTLDIQRITTRANPTPSGH
jgi:hypothetical protein